MMRFKDKVALISGAASGMGLLTARNLVSEGAKVVLTDIDPETAEAAAAGLRKDGGAAMAAQVDVRVYEQVQLAADATVQNYGRIDLMLNFAGGAEGRMRNCAAP